MYNNVQTPSPTEAAKQEVARLFQMEHDLTEKRRGKLASIEATRRGAAQSILDEGASIEDAAVATLREQIEARTIEEAIALARQRRLAAIQRSYGVEAGELRAAAQVKRGEAAEILRRCEPFLRKLSDLQGLTYDATILLAQRNGTWTGSIITGRVLEQCNPLESQPDIGAGFFVPRSRNLLNEAEALEQQARALDSREVHQDYSIEKPSVAELLAAEELRNPVALAPAVNQVEAWVEALEARVRRERPELVLGDVHGIARRRRYKLVWKAGEIDPDYSSLTFPGVSYSGGDPTFVVGAAA